VRGSDLGFAVTASTATVELGDTALGKTIAVAIDVDEVDDEDELEDEDEDEDELDEGPGSFTVTTGVHEQAVDEMVVDVVAILGDVVHGLVTVVASGPVVTSLPSFAAVSLTNRS
jgi:hypothetical protein